MTAETVSAVMFLAAFALYLPGAVADWRRTRSAADTRTMQRRQAATTALRKAVTR